MSRNSVFRERHSYLVKYLSSSIREFEARATSTAMQRIARLPMEQFYDVSTDLNDELDRRLHNSECILLLIVPFLPIRNDLAPKRNQARQKMATLNEQRYL